MRMTFEVAIVAALAGCAEGGSATDQARDDHDLGVFNNVKLALTPKSRRIARTSMRSCTTLALNLPRHLKSALLRPNP